MSIIRPLPPSVEQGGVQPGANNSPSASSDTGEFGQWVDAASSPRSPHYPAGKVSAEPDHAATSGPREPSHGSDGIKRPQPHPHPAGKGDPSRQYTASSGLGKLNHGPDLTDLAHTHPHMAGKVADSQAGATQPVIAESSGLVGVEKSQRIPQDSAISPGKMHGNTDHQSGKASKLKSKREDSSKAGIALAAAALVSHNHSSDLHSRDAGQEARLNSKAGTLTGMAESVDASPVSRTGRVNAAFTVRASRTKEGAIASSIAPKDAARVILEELKARPAAAGKASSVGHSASIPAHPTAARQLRRTPTEVKGSTVTRRSWPQGGSNIQLHTPVSHKYSGSDFQPFAGVSAPPPAHLSMEASAAASNATSARPPVADTAQSGPVWHVTAVQVVPHQLVAARIKPPFHPAALEARVVQFLQTTKVSIAVPSALSNWTSGLSRHQEELAGALAQVGMPSPSVRVEGVSGGMTSPGFAFQNGGQPSGGGGQFQSGGQNGMSQAVYSRASPAGLGDDVSQSESGTRW